MFGALVALRAVDSVRKLECGKTRVSAELPDLLCFAEQLHFALALLLAYIAGGIQFFWGLSQVSDFVLLETGLLAEILELALVSNRRQEALTGIRPRNVLLAERADFQTLLVTFQTAIAAELFNVRAKPNAVFAHALGVHRLLARRAFGQSLLVER